MLSNETVFAVIAVKDLNTAKQFYAGTLGLRPIDENPNGVTYTSGSGNLFIYQAPSAGTNQATSAGWEVGDIEEIVDELKGKGVTFLQYDIPGTTKQGDITVMGSRKSAWFQDPDGNILSIGSNQ